MSCPAAMREYAIRKTGTLLDDVVFALHHAARLPDPEAIHKMRVSIRRLQQAVRLFKQYLKKSGVEKTRTEMRGIMKIAGELRNRDIAIELIREAGGEIDELSEQRTRLKQELSDVLGPYSKPDLSLRWRRRLGIDTP
jgi:CHAD domain-containing protein